MKITKTLLVVSSLAIAALSHAGVFATFRSTGDTVKGLQGDYTKDFDKLTKDHFAKVKESAYDAEKYYGYLPGGWVNPEKDDWTGDKKARWVTVGSFSGLYKVSFTVGTDVEDARLNLTYTCDDQFGSKNNEGLFMDGKAIEKSRTDILWNGKVESKSWEVGKLKKGTHDLYIDVVNTFGYPSGVLFSGSITGKGNSEDGHEGGGDDGHIQTVPEPTSLAVLALGGLFLKRRRK